MGCPAISVVKSYRVPREGMVVRCDSVGAGDGKKGDAAPRGMSYGGDYFRGKKWGENEKKGNNL